MFNLTCAPVHTCVQVHCTGTHADLTRNPVLGGFVGQESREGYGYTSINTTQAEEISLNNGLIGLIAYI